MRETNLYVVLIIVFIEDYPYRDDAARSKAPSLSTSPPKHRT